jgi:hypothetical protein
MFANEVLGSFYRDRSAKPKHARLRGPTQGMALWWSSQAQCRQGRCGQGQLSGDNALGLGPWKLGSFMAGVCAPDAGYLIRSFACLEGTAIENTETFEARGGAGG